MDYLYETNLRVQLKGLKSERNGYKHETLFIFGDGHYTNKLCNHFHIL